jgi:iron complex outermembrane recepter protein
MMKSAYAAVLVAASVLAISAAQQARAQDAPANQSATDDQNKDIVVTGTRVVGRSRLDTASPVDVLSGNSLRQQGTAELSQSLAAVAPSIDFPRSAITGGTDSIRPVTLRGLSPDQTLVLINGVRAHPAALLNINSSVGRGAAAVDLNTIPTVALETIEVLRDGASAQYGSDAIGGVVNLRLREARSGGGASVTYGFYDTGFDGRLYRRNITGEPTVQASAWQGIGFGSDGYITVSGEYYHRNYTNRADVDPRSNPAQITGRYGDPIAKQYTGWVNAGTSLTDNVKLYGWVGYQYRDSISAPTFRTAAQAVTVSGIYPNGFLPLTDIKSRDLNSAIGLKMEFGDWKLDLNVSYGRNTDTISALNTANFTYGNASKTRFYDGVMKYDQLIGGLDVTREFAVFKSLNLAFGVEGRRESFAITPGEPASYDVGPAFPTAQPGAQGFGGFSIDNAVDKSRSNVSGYVDLEAQINDQFLIGIAGRAEHYSDFGSTATGKISLRYDVAPWFALRGTASTGFRAPSLQQSYFTSTTSVITNGVPQLTGTYPSVSNVAKILGGLPLEPEKATNFSVGTVVRFSNFSLTVDGYHIKLRNGLGLSENISSNVSPAIAALLKPLGVVQARFFINGVSTTTQGIDVVANYRLKTQAVGTFNFTVSGNVNSIEVTKVPLTTATLNPAPELFSRQRVMSIENGTPGEKVTGSIDWSLGDLGGLVRLTHYGNVIQPGTTASLDSYTGKHVITDLEFRYAPKKGAQLALGVSNLFDIYPKAISPIINTTGLAPFPSYSPFGFNGRYLYVRAGLNW